MSERQGDHILSIELRQVDNKIMAYVKQADEPEDEPMELPAHIAAQLPMAISMMREQLS